MTVTTELPVMVRTDRSRYVRFKCPRARFLEYEIPNGTIAQDGTEGRGWSPARPSYDIEIGSGVHKVLERILTWWMRASQREMSRMSVDSFLGMLQAPINDSTVETWLDRAISAGFEEFNAAVKPWLDTELAPPETVTVSAEQMEAAGIPGLGEIPGLGDLNFEIGGEQQPELLYQYHESLAMLDALSRAYVLAPSGLRWLLSTYEVLAVETEITVPINVDLGYGEGVLELMGRPDGILRDRSSGEYFVFSLKTTKEWDKRKESAFKYDDQGISETIVGQHWLRTLGIEDARIMGVQTVALLKGGKRQDKGSKEYRYTNGLIRPYKKPVMNDWKYQMDYSWEDSDGNGHNIGKGWTKANIWEPGERGVGDWIQAIASGSEPLNGYMFSELSNEYVGSHPLDQFVVNPIFYRNEEDLRDWMEMFVSQETNIRRDRDNLEKVTPDVDPDGERRRAYINCLFPMRRSCCTYPVNCEYIPVCHEGLSISGSGLYKPRVANHPQEVRGSGTEEG